jgi:hypothetical protein
MRGFNPDPPLQPVLSFQHTQQPIEKLYVLRTQHLRHHDRIEIRAGAGDDGDNILIGVFGCEVMIRTQRVFFPQSTELRPSMIFWRALAF